MSFGTRLGQYLFAPPFYKLSVLVGTVSGPSI